jgi:hypothetical protein
MAFSSFERYWVHFPLCSFSSNKVNGKREGKVWQREREREIKR